MKLRENEHDEIERRNRKEIVIRETLVDTTNSGQC